MPEDDRTPMVRNIRRHEGWAGEVVPITSAKGSLVRKCQRKDAEHKFKQ